MALARRRARIRRSKIVAPGGKRRQGTFDDRRKRSRHIADHGAQLGRAAGVVGWATNQLVKEHGPGSEDVTGRTYHLPPDLLGGHVPWRPLNPPGSSVARMSGREVDWK